MKELNDLTDLEICEEIARIEDVSEKTRYRKPRYRGRDGEYLYIDRSNEEFSPLTDWNITGSLMVKYKIDFFHRDNIFSASDNKSFVADDNNPQRAICLVIIAQHRLNGETK